MEIPFSIYLVAIYKIVRAHLTFSETSAMDIIIFRWFSNEMKKVKNVFFTQSQTENKHVGFRSFRPQVDPAPFEIKYFWTEIHKFIISKCFWLILILKIQTL